MSFKNMIILVACCFLGYAVNAQSFFKIDYSFDSLPSVKYHSFFILHDDGTGLVRIRSQQQDNDIVIEADAVEQPVQLAPGITDSLHTIFAFINPRVITGKLVGKPDLPLIYLGLDAKGNLEAEAMLRPNYTTIQSGKLKDFASQKMGFSSISKNFLLQYFSEDEEFYSNFFRPVTRGFTSAERNTRMHLLVVTNTNDKSIGNACKFDKARIIQTFSDLSNYLGVKLITDTIAGKIYNKKNVETAIKKLSPSANDIVIFYYSGHGFRKSGQASLYPMIDLRSKPKDDYLKESLSMEDIYSRIKSKKARFNLVLSDCCNTEVAATNAIASRPLQTKNTGINWSENNTRQLFLSRTPISLLATAANAGQKATCNSTFGGFFSWFFKSSMESSCSVLKTSASWDEVMQVAQKQTINKARFTYCDKPYIPENICDQSPIYKLEIGMNR